MSEKKNIDRLFQEKFKEFEVTPNDAVWDRISKSLSKKKKKRKIIPIWWQLGGVAAIIALLLTVGNIVSNSNDSNDEIPTIVNTEDKDNKAPAVNDKQTVDGRENTLIVDSKTNKSIITKENEPSKKGTAPNSLTSSKNNEKFNSVAHHSNNSNISSKQTNTITSTQNSKNNIEVADNIKLSEKNIQNTMVDDTTIKSVIKETIEKNNTLITDNTSKSQISEIGNQKNNTENIDPTTKKEQSSLIEDSNKPSINTVIAAQENINEKEEDEKQNRWSIAPNVAPVYFSSLGEGSAIGTQFNQNSKSSDINISYGITGAYTISKKLKVRAGINRVNLSQTTTDVLAFTGEEFVSRNRQPQVNNVNVKNDFSNVTLLSANIFDRNTTPELFNTKIPGNLDQRFGFIEVPLELEYRLLDKKFGLNIIGGFSTLFLSQNEVFADINGTSTLIGEANNINSTSFSANFGLGFDYSLSKQWNVTFEPQFKYQINTFTNTFGNFRPFFIGVYTGLSYKF